MTRGWGIVAVLGVIVAVLAVVARLAVRDAAIAPESAPDRRQARAVDSGGSVGRRPPSGQPADAIVRGSGTGMPGPEDATRRRAQDRLARVRPGEVTMGVSGGAPARRAEIGVDGPAGAAPAAAHRPEPPAPSAPQAAADADLGDDSPPPADVAYDGATRVFDTAQPVQIEADTVVGNTGSMAFWARPEWDEGNTDPARFVQLGDTGLRIVKDGSFLRLEYTDINGDNALGGVADLGLWQSGEWRYVTATWQDGTFSLYLDGERVFMNAPPVPPPLRNDPRIYVGSIPVPGGEPIAPAQLAQLQVLARYMSPDEIRARFATLVPPDS